MVFRCVSVILLFFKFLIVDLITVNGDMQNEKLSFYSLIYGTRDVANNGTYTYIYTHLRLRECVFSLVSLS